MYGANNIYKDKLAQASSWLAHTSGDIAVVAARRPEQYISGNAHRLFVDGRQHLVST